jgi:hypothetical protein
MVSGGVEINLHGWRAMPATRPSCWRLMNPGTSRSTVPEPCVDEKSALAHQTCALSSRTEVESIGARLDINLHAQTKVETITEALGNDQTPCGIDGSSHTKLVFFLW